MKHNLPFWKKLPDSWKQVFVALGATITVLQAIHFIVATPMGIIEGIKYRSQVEHSFWWLREDAAAGMIAETILFNRNSPLFSSGYYEECIETNNSYNPFTSGLAESDCDNLERLSDIISQSIKMFEVPEGSLPQFYESLEMRLGLPREHLTSTE